jgi:hypothetical protein
MSLHTKKTDTSAAVDQFMSELRHPFKAEIQAIRELALSLGGEVQEGIKWNAPSYRTSEYFATTNLRVKNGIGVILHLGAKVRDETVAIDDPQQLLTWLGSDRASVSFSGMEEFKAKRPAFKAILEQWIPYV